MVWHGVNPVLGRALQQHSAKVGKEAGVTGGRRYMEEVTKVARDGEAKAAGFGV